MAGDIDSAFRPHLERLLAPGEQLEAFCVATQHSLFKGRMVAIGVTEGRLLIQGFDRRMQPDGDVLSLTPAEIASARAQGAGGGWANVSALIMDRVAITVKLAATAGQKLQLTMMEGGTGLIGKLGGGETQRQGVEALAQWMQRHMGQA